jgi:hypothetical protein
VASFSSCDATVSFCSLAILLKGSSKSPAGLPIDSITVAELDLSLKEYEALTGELGFDAQAALLSHAGTGFGFMLLPFPVDIIGP